MKRYLAVEVEDDRVRVEAEGFTFAALSRVLAEADAWAAQVVSGPVREESMTATPAGVGPSADPQPTAAPALTFSCDVCGKDGMSKQGLAVHTSRKHKGKSLAEVVTMGYQCDVCAATFRTHDALRVHSLSKHDRLPKQGPA